MSNTSIRQYLQDFDDGKFNSPSVAVQIYAGWYDWFCKDSSLEKKTQKLSKKLKQIANSPKINQDTMYVFFKNNCPMNGSLYDDFRICDIETGDVIFCVIPSSGHACEKGKALVYTKREYVCSGSWKDVVKWFNEGNS